MERKTFMRNLGDVLLCISIVMLCIFCVAVEFRVRKIEQRINDAEINIAAVGNTNEEIKTSVDDLSSNTDAQFESINQKLDEYQGDIDELAKTVEELTTEEVTEEETTEEQTTEESKDSAVVSTPKQVVSNPAPAPEPEPEPEPEVDEEPETAEESDDDTSGMTYMGTWCISAYEASGNPCANGNMPTEWYTCAFNSAPRGATIYIEGLGYFVNEDYCGTPSRLDIYLGDVETCRQFGLQYHDVYIVN